MNFSETEAAEILAIAGIEPEHEHYAFLLALLKDIMVRETRRANAVARIGGKLIKLAEGRQTAAVSAEISRLGTLLAEERPSGGIILQVSRTFVQLSKLLVTEGERQSANRDRKQAERNRRIAERFRELTETMSERAAARKIRSELKLTISEARIRQIGSKETG